MPKASLLGIDSAGGAIVGPGAAKLRSGGVTVSLLGDAVAGHGDAPHSGPSMVQGSSRYRVGGVPVVLQGHTASCGHTASGSSRITVSS